MTIQLRPITADNWREAVRLKVAEHQKNWVAPNVYSLAQAAYETENRPHGVYDGETMVGFIMFGLEEYEGQQVWGINRVMIGADFQRRGYGRAAMNAILNLMREEDAANDVYISYVPGNEGAPELYESFGFVHVGKTPDGDEELMHRQLIAL
jgi:diamine N-acetyltransferase